MIYLTLKCTLAHSTILKSRLELNFVGGTFFFSRSRAGLTNRVPVRDSRAGAPLILVKLDRTKAPPLEGLPQNVIPIVPVTKTFTVNKDGSKSLSAEHNSHLPLHTHSQITELKVKP